MEKNKELPLRLNVGIVLVNNKNKIFVAKRIDLNNGILPNLTNKEKFWQMPQGGIDINENFIEAAKRELAEETNVKSVKLIKEVDGWLKYYFPPDIQKKCGMANMRVKNKSGL
jgi:putative (di)nucleoside polyphosphate hydrolase